MMKRYLQLSASLLTLLTINATAAVRYVDLNSASPTPPYTNWATAATTIQAAVDVAVAGDEILVTNGVYQTGGRAAESTLTNRVVVDKPVTVQSVNGPAVTVIQGYQVPGTTNGDGAIRCVYLTNGASLSGFTLINGGTKYVDDLIDHPEADGGGVFCTSTDVVVSNCLVTGNSAALQGGGAFRGTLYNCILSGNSVTATYDARGGGASASILNNCILTGNSSVLDGGGVANSTLNNCLLSGNSAAEDGGGALFSTLNNCLVTGNSAYFGGGTSYGTLSNCTVVGNSAVSEGGGAYGGASQGRLYNCIVYYNISPSSPDQVSCYAINSCAGNSGFYGGSSGNITNAPLFLDLAGGNLRLQTNSPCINTGNNGYAVGSSDFDGRLRIVGGIVDMGAYEFQGPGMGEFIGWLQQYLLPTDGSADYVDGDGDLLNNWQEWIAGTDPTNSLSVLRLLNPTNNGSGVGVSWQSVSGRSYWLERATNLGALPPFSLLKSNITGQAGTTSYTDTNAVGNDPFFYRVGVQQ